MILKLVSDRTESRSQNLRLIFESFVMFVLYKLTLVYISSHSSNFVCFVTSLFKTTALPVCICKRRLARWGSLCTLILNGMSLLALPHSLTPHFPHTPLPLNRLYLIWNVYQCMCFRLLIGHNCTHLIFLRTCFQSSDNVLIANYR